MQFSTLLDEIRDAKKKEVLLPEQEMVLLESLLLARYYIAKDLQEITNLSFFAH
jgi:hypothetical protein